MLGNVKLTDPANHVGRIRIPADEHEVKIAALSGQPPDRREEGFKILLGHNVGCLNDDTPTGRYRQLGWGDIAEMSQVDTIADNRQALPPDTVASQLPPLMPADTDHTVHKTCPAVYPKLPRITPGHLVTAVATAGYGNTSAGRSGKKRIEHPVAKRIDQKDNVHGASADDALQPEQSKRIEPPVCDRPAQLPAGPAEGLVQYAAVMNRSYDEVKTLTFQGSHQVQRDPLGPAEHQVAHDHQHTHFPLTFIPVWAGFR